MDFGELLKTTWDMYMKGIVRLVLFTVLGAVLCMTVVLIPAVMGGWTRGFLSYVREGKEPAFEELWNFDRFWQILLVLLIGGTLIAIGYMLLIIPGLLLNVIWMYALFFLIDRREMGFWDAMTASKDMVTASGFANHFLILLIVAVLNSIGSAFSGLGTLLTAPFGFLLMALVYDRKSSAAPVQSAAE